VGIRKGKTLRHIQGTINLSREHMRAKTECDDAICLRASIAISGDQLGKNIMNEVKETVCDFGNLYRAMRKCAKSVKWKDSVAGYVNNGLANCLRLQKSLESNTYKIDDYTLFTIYEPKKREIVSTRMKDRVFQRSLCDNYLYENITKHFIRDNCACQVGKGTDFARDRLCALLHDYYRKYGNKGYVLQCDLSNYFGSTPHAVGKSKVDERVSDKWVVGHVANIIDTYKQGPDPEIGMGLGSQITQLIQLAVLDDIDHDIKERKHIHHYVRYADDFILIHPDKDYLIQCHDDIQRQLSGMQLTLSPKKTKLYPISQGINFLGFHFRLLETGKVLMTLNRENIADERRKLRRQRKLADKGIMTKKQCDECYQSWKSHAENRNKKRPHKKANTHNLIIEMDKFYKELWRDYNVRLQIDPGAADGGTPQE